MANIVLRNGWNQPATYKNVASVTFQTDVEGVTATYYENGSGGSGGLGAQANWLQNDSQAADYIKNRPFYSDYTVILPPQLAEFVEETYEGKSLYGAVLGELENFSETKYTVIWGEDLWFCDVVEREDKKYIGDLNIIGIQVENNNTLELPPFLGVYEGGLLTFYSAVPEALFVGLGGPENIHKINSKYWPEVMMGNADWNAMPGEPGYIANKPTTLGLDEEALAKYLVDNKYITEEYVTKALTDFEKKIPSVEEFITEDEVAQKIKEAIDGINKALEEYAKTSWVSDNFALKSDLQGVVNRVKTIEENYINKTTFKTLEDTVAALQKALADYKTEVEKTYATKTELTNSQADWDVEDKTNLAAIKNKPFGIYADLIPNISYSEDSFIRVNNSDGVLVYKLQTGLALTNTQYEVIWNEEKFICVPDVKTLGAPFLLSMDGSFTTETFPSGRTTITLRLLDNIYRLDKKFLPKDVATEEYVDDKIGEIEQSNWTETNPNSKAYIRNKPTIPAAQVNADWNATSGVARILNKPTIPAAPVNADWNATSGLAFIKNKPTIPAAQVHSDWTEEDSNKVSFIENKPTIPDPQVNSDWGEENPAAISFIRNKPNFFSDWNAVDGKTRIVNMPAVFRHSVEADDVEEMLIDTASGWKKQMVERLTMTVTFDDDSVKTYSIIGKEVIE